MRYAPGANDPTDVPACSEVFNFSIRFAGVSLGYQQTSLTVPSLTLLAVNTSASNRRWREPVVQRIYCVDDCAYNRADVTHFRYSRPQPRRRYFNFVFDLETRNAVSLPQGGN